MTRWRSCIRSAFLGKLLLIVAVALVPLLLLHGATIQQNQALAEREAEGALKSHAADIAAQAAGTMARARRMVAYVAERPEVTGLDRARCSEAITGLNGVDPAFVTLLVLDAQGQPFCSSRPTETGLPETYADRAWFQQALRSGGTEVGNPRIGSLAHRPILPVTGTVRGPDGAVRAVVVLSLDLIKLSRCWGEERQAAGLQATVMGADGTVLARFPAPEDWIGRRLEVEPGKDGGAGRAYERARVAGEAWEVWASQPTAPMFLLARQERLQALGVTVLVALIALGLAMMLASRLSRSLADLSRTARDAATGTGTLRADVNVPTIFLEVTQALNALLDARDGAQRRVERLASINAALSQTNRAMARHSGAAQLFNELCRICVDAGHASGAMIVLRDAGEGAAAGSFRPVAAHGRDWAGVLRSVSGPCSEAAAPGVLLDRVLREGRTFTGAYDLACRTERGEARGSLAVLPFREGGEVRGALTLAMAEADYFDAELLQALEEMTADLSFALDLGVREAARLAAEKEVSASRDRLRTAFNTLPVGTLICAADTGEVLEVNDTLCKRYGIQRADLIGRHFTALPVSLGEAQWASLFGRVSAGEKVRNLEFRVEPHGRRPVQILVNAELIEFDGRSCMLTASIDITEHKQAQRELVRREQQLSSVVEHATDAIVTIDASGRITVFNRAASRMFGISSRHALALEGEVFVKSRIRGTQREAFSAFLLSNHAATETASWLQQLCGVAADGSEFPIEATLMRVADDGSEGGPLRIAVLRDVTAALLAKQARQARVAAEVANEAKTQFLTRMSHELRTPLNAVLGFAQLLQVQGADSGEEPGGKASRLVRSYSRHILGAGRHLLELVNDMLDISRIEAGQLNLALEPVGVAEVVEEAVSLVRAMARSHGVELHVPAPGLGTACVVADPQRLRQVIVNLLSNGIKYNRPQGTVAVRVMPRDTTLSIEIEDNGLGMSAEQLAQLFEPFNRLGRDRTRIEGTGIGMALTRQLIGLMGGTIEVHSETEVGTRVRVNLALSAEAPTPSVARVAAAERDDDAAPSGTVLYIEDNPVNVLLLQEFFRRWPGIRLEIAENGEDGIRLAKALDPDLVLLDMQLPDMDGVDVLAAFKRDGSDLGQRTVALSASAMQADAARARAAGASDYWTKPLDFARFEVAVSQLMRRERQRGDAGSLT